MPYILLKHIQKKKSYKICNIKQTDMESAACYVSIDSIKKKKILKQVFYEFFQNIYYDGKQLMYEIHEYDHCEFRVSFI